MHLESTKEKQLPLFQQNENVHRSARCNISYQSVRIITINRDKCFTSRGGPAAICLRINHLAAQCSGFLLFWRYGTQQLSLSQISRPTRGLMPVIMMCDVCVARLPCLPQKGKDPKSKGPNGKKSLVRTGIKDVLKMHCGQKLTHSCCLTDL